MTASCSSPRLPWLPVNVKILPLPQPPAFPDQPKPGVPRAVRKATIAFANLLIVTVSTISEVDPRMRQLTLKIAQQYNYVVLLPALQWLRANCANVASQDRELHRTEECCNALPGVLRAAGLELERGLDEWINLTIFDITNAAFAPEATEDLSCRVSKAPWPGIQRWMDSLKELGPLAVVFDVDARKIGTFVPRWAKCEILKASQQERRNECFPAEVKRHLSEVRRVLETVVAEIGGPEASLVEGGRSAVSAAFGADCLSARLCHGSHWLSANAKLQPLAQCAGCQVIYAGVNPIVDNDPVRAKPLSQNFALPWQCGEFHLFAQLFEREQACQNIEVKTVRPSRAESTVRLRGSYVDGQCLPE